jgi:hypothetical protein
LKQLISQFKIIFHGIIESGGIFIAKITNAIVIFFSTYFEVLRTGGIQTTATGEKVIINYQANVCGDILIFMGPRHSDHSRVDLIEHVQLLLLSDSTLKQKNELALESLQQKLQGLMFLPKMFAVIVSVLLSLLVYWKAAGILAILNYQIDLVIFQKVVPLVILLTTFIFRKFVGFKLIKYITWLINFLKRITLKLKAVFQ